MLTVGHLDAAERAGGCLVRLVEQQPDPQRFYFRMTLAGDLVTDAPPAQQLGCFVDARKTAQIYFHPGIAMILLCRLHLATGQRRYLTAAETIFDFTRRCAADVYASAPSGKLGLGCALLGRIAGRDDARAAAAQVAAYLVDTQTPDGSWRLPDSDVYRSIEDKNDPEITLDLTAEFATFLWEIAAALNCPA